MEITTYKEAIAYVEDLIKPFQVERIEGVPEEYNNPLGRMKYLLQLIGNPQEQFPSVVVSGTSGKSSTTYYIAHLLTTAGYNVGMTISPHLQKLNERMQMNDRQITDDQFVQLLNEIVPAIEQMKKSSLGAPSYFETLLAIAFLYFAKEKVDIVVAEVGLEGEYDGTNVLNKLAFVYTNTSLDHTQILGDTVEAIAHEGVAGIEKFASHYHTPLVISGVSQPSVRDIFIQAAQKESAVLRLLGRDFQYSVERVETSGDVFTYRSSGIEDSLQLPMRGAYQAENATLAIDTVLQLQQFGFIVSQDVIRQAIHTAFFPGRFEFVGEHIILDGAHNPAKMEAFITSLQKLYSNKKKIFILGFKEGKNITEMLRISLPVADMVITTAFHIATDMTKKPSIEADVLYELVMQHASLPQNIPAYKTLTTEEAIKKAQVIQKEYPESLIIITGSLYLVGEARELLGA